MAPVRGTTVGQPLDVAVTADPVIDEVRHYGRVVVGVDGSSNARHALEWAADEARARDAVLHVVYVGPIQPDRVPEWLPDGAGIEAVDQAVVDDAVGLAALRHPDLVVRGEVLWGAPSEQLVDAGEEADLLVVGARGSHGFLGLLIGSVSERCIHNARGPLAVIRQISDAQGIPTHGGRVVVGVDGSTDARWAMRWALDEAEVRGASVEAVVAWQYPPTHAVVATSALRFAVAAREVERLAKEEAGRWAPDVPFTVSVRDEAIVPALLDRARGAELLVVGPHGQGGYRDFLLGSVANQCVHHAPCPVVVARHPVVQPTDLRRPTMLLDASYRVDVDAVGGR